MVSVKLRVLVAVLLVGLACPVLAAGQTAARAAPAPPPPHHMLKVGAWLGGAVMVSHVAMDIRACGTGCELGSGVMVFAALAGTIGARVGAGLGHMADKYAAADRASSGRGNRFFPPRPTVRIGASASQLAFQSALVEGTAMAPGGSVVWQVSPYVSAHAEYSSANARFTAAPGSISQDVLDNIVAAPGRIAGRSFGIESRRAKYVYSQLIGIHPRPFGRVRVEFLAGLGVQAQENRNYYAESRTVDGARVTTEKYYVLDFQSPKSGVVMGIDAEVAVVPSFSIVPTFRYNRMGDPGATRMIGIGAHWRF